MSDIKAEMINSFRNNLKNKKYTGRTINEYLRILESIFNSFCDWNTECINSLRKKEKVIYERHDIFTDEEIESLIKKASDKNEMEMKFLILIGYNTGLRLKNIVLLEWRNINLEKKLLTLKTSKTGGDVTLWLEDEFIKELSQLKAEEADKKYVLPKLANMYETSDYRNKGDKIIKKFTRLMKLSDKLTINLDAKYV